MKYENLMIGDRVSLDGGRKPFGQQMDARWFVMTADRTRRGMTAAAAWLVGCGTTECWFPQEERFRVKVIAGKKRREKYQAPIIPGLLFVLTDRVPAFDVMIEVRRIKPLMICGQPVTVTEAVMSEMETVPRRVEELRIAAERARQAEIAAKLPKPGEQATFRVGPLAGRSVTVGAVDAGEGTAVVEIFGMGRAVADLSSLERLG